MIKQTAVKFQTTEKAKAKVATRKILSLIKNAKIDMKEEGVVLASMIEMKEASLLVTSRSLVERKMTKSDHSYTVIKLELH